MEGAKTAGDLAASDEQCPSTLVAVHTAAKCGIAVLGNKYPAGSARALQFRKRTGSA